MKLLHYQPVGPNAYAVRDSAGGLLGVVHRCPFTIGAWQLDGGEDTHYPSREMAAWALVKAGPARESVSRDIAPEGAGNERAGVLRRAPATRAREVASC